MEHPQLEQFIYEHGEELLRLAYTYVKKHDVAEDLVQDVLLKAFEQREQFLGQSSYRTYLYRMTINRCYDYFRSWSYRNTIVTEQITKFMKKPLMESKKSVHNSSNFHFQFSVNRNAI